MRLRLITGFLAFVLGLAAQTAHKVTLTWTDTLNPAGTTYSVYRAPGLCSGSPSFSQISTGLTAKTFEDNNVQPGPYCYVVTATYTGVESPHSNSALAQVPSFPPTGLSVQVQ